MSNMVRSLEETARLASAALANLESDISEKTRDAYLANGGCEKCGGRGWRVVWDTMDSMSGCYAEYGSCDACTPEERTAAGLNPSYYSKYDGNKGVSREALKEAKVALMSDGDKARLSGALALCEATKAAYEAAKDAATPRKGRYVKVLRGKSKGYEGEVFWVGPSKWGGGERLGLRTSSGETAWANVGSCKVLETPALEASAPF